MKTRQGFVSNSSTTSFLIDLDEITGLQLVRIQAWLKATNEQIFAEHGYNSLGWEWSESHKTETMYGTTETCPTDEIKKFFDTLGLTDVVRWEKR